MRILHILDHSIPLHSGYSFRTRSILEQQRALGWETIQLTSSKHYGTDALEEDVDGFHFYRTPPGGGLMNRLPVLNQYSVVVELAHRLEQVVEKERPNILHAHSPCLNGLAALRVGRRRRLPVVYELRASWEDAAVSHGTTRYGSLRYRVSRGLETYVLKRADAVTTICEGLRQDILIRDVPPDKVTVIPNAVDPEHFQESAHTNPELRNTLLLQNKRVIGFIGSFYDYEGLDLLLRAVPLIRAQCPDVRVLLVGGGPQEQNLKQLAKELRIDDEVIFAGRVPHGDVTGYYDLIDVLVYPRRSIRLTELVTPLKPLEAMAQRRLFVASNVGGHRELIKDGVTGVLFAPEDPDALARAVIQCLAQPEQWPARLDAARRFVETERTWKYSVARYQPIYERLVR